jgi:uncharacterized membrane protein
VGRVGENSDLPYKTYLGMSITGLNLIILLFIKSLVLILFFFFLQKKTKKKKKKKTFGESF